MRLRHILALLSLLAFASASTGGYFYYDSLREAAFKDADRQAASRVQLLKRNLSAYLSENIKTVKALAGMEELLEMLVRPNPKAQDEANATLDLFKDALKVDVCYLINGIGTTIASSNRDAPDSFLGKNFAFRPYFQQAIHSAPATYLALGTTSKKRGVYYSFPIFEKGEDLPIGLAVIKASIELIEKELNLSDNELFLVVSPNGIIFISNRSDWLYRSIRKLSRDESEKIRKSRQFGAGPWAWIGFDFSRSDTAIGHDGHEYQLHRTDIDENHPGWEIFHLQSYDAIAKSVSQPLIEITGPIVLSLCVLIGFSVFLLYQKASKEILKRKSVEEALRESDERYRSLYHNTPAMLHSIDKGGRIVSVSDYWSEALGYQREEVVGKHLTDFLAEDSRHQALNIVFPEFFEKGYCKDIPYQLVKKDGTVIDVLLSAIAIRDETGEIHRSLAVSIDVTERLKAERALQQAKEELSRHSKNLERQVRERSREISAILKYTPDVVTIKDQKGRYRLINTRYESLLGLQNDEMRGKTDADVFPGDVAEKVRSNDRTVLEENRPMQVEERLPVIGGIRTFLSVKYPFYSESGDIIGVGCISTDITELKRAQDQLRRLSGSIIVNQEKERAAIARELHDELGQVMTALRMDAVWLSERLKKSDETGAGRALTMCSLIDKTIEDIRGLAIRLRPGVLDDLGLVDALEWVTSDFERRTGIACVFEPKTGAVLDDAISTAAYRITQEALTNVARHAEASHVSVSLSQTDGKLVLSVKDDGNGFSLKTLDESEGLGVAGMRERATLVGGDLTVASEPGKGACVRFSVAHRPDGRN